MIENQRHNFGWDAASAVLHALFFLLLILFTPVRELVVPVPKPPPPAAEKLSREKIERLDEMLADARMRELQNFLDDLQTILNDMEVVRDQMRQDFDDVVETLSADAKDALRQASEDAKALQHEALAKQDAAAETVDRLAEAEKKDLDQSAKDVDEARNKLDWTQYPDVAAAQANAQNALDAIRTAASFSALEKVAEAASALREAQIEAARIQVAEAREVVDPARRLEGYEAAVNAKAEAERRAEAEKKTAAEELAKKETFEAARQDADRRNKEAETRRAEAERQRAEAEKARDAARREKDAAVAEKRRAKDEEGKQKADAAAKDAQARADESEKARADAQRRANEARAERDRADHERRQAENRAREAATRAERAAARAAEQAKNAENAQKRIDERRAAAKEIDAEAQRRHQADARAAQQKVLDAMEKLDQAIEIDVAAPKSHVSDEEIPSELAVRDTSRLTLSEAYEMARTLEEAVTETYREVVAASTALEQRLSLEEAENLTDVAKPVREDIDAELLDGRARDAETLAAQKEARYGAVREAENMVDASMEMLEEALRIAGANDAAKATGRDDRGGRSLKWLRRGDLAGRDRSARVDRFIALSGLAAQLEDAAAENSAVRAKDMTAITRLGAQAEADDRPPEDESVREAGRIALESSRTGSDSTPRGSALPGTGKDLLPGNVLSTDESSRGMPGNWMFLESWWIIGPFPNPGRVNLTRKFPPESVVDLDAAYEGRDGLVRWRFVQATSSPLEPYKDTRAQRAEVKPPEAAEYTIWYGWTLLVVDRECDVWLAAGSDDRSDIWVNGMKVWASGNELKQWSIIEGFRRVHLKEGANEVLVRVENGHWNCGFSVCVSPHETPPPL